MKIEILVDQKFALGGIEVRDFKKGEVVEIKDAHAYRMIDLKIACKHGEKKPAPVVGAPVDDAPDEEPSEKGFEEAPAKTKGKKKSKKA